MSKTEKGIDGNFVDVDAVVTWVDGSEWRHIRKRQEALGRESKSLTAIPAGKEPTRFVDNNEVEYCIRSIRKFAPWVRKIHLVTDRQRPRFLSKRVQRELVVNIVDHADIFSGYENALPTFNSLSIESLLHKIPGLAPRYIYFNDDFSLLRPVKISDFFTEDGRVVIRGVWQRLPSFGKARMMISRFLNRALKLLFGVDRAMSALQQIRGAQLAGMKGKYFRSSHAPYPMVKETLEDFFSDRSFDLERNVSYRFRNLDQFATTSLSNHVEIIAGNAILKSPDDCLMICFNRDLNSTVRRKLEKLAGGQFKFLCLQSLEQAALGDRARALCFLEESIGKGGA